MLFHEIYNAYYGVITRILTEAAEHPVEPDAIRKRIKEEAFSESALAICPKLSSQEWPLLPKGRSVLHHAPHTPLSTMELRWLKTIGQDPRVRLFCPAWDLPADIEPLWKEEDILYFDRYQDGDPFTKAAYVAHFHTLLTAIKEKKQISLQYHSQKGKQFHYTGSVQQIEYSPKDDKFRVLLYTKKSFTVLNVAGIEACQLLSKPAVQKAIPVEKKQVRLSIRDERHALDRAMLTFSDLPKVTRALTETSYEMTLFYDALDETEILIRILAFGPFMKIQEPKDMVECIKERLRRQRQLMVDSQLLTVNC